MFNPVWLPTSFLPYKNHYLPVIEWKDIFKCNVALKCVSAAFSKLINLRPCFLMFICVSLGEKLVLSSSMCNNMGLLWVVYIPGFWLSLRFGVESSMVPLRDREVYLQCTFILTTWATLSALFEFYMRGRHLNAASRLWYNWLITMYTNTCMELTLPWYIITAPA